MAPKNRSVIALAYDSLCMFEFAVAAELFGLDRPELGVDWYDFAVVSVDGGPLRSLGGVTVQAAGGLDLIETAGTVVIPGWRDREDPPPSELIEALRNAHDRGARLVSICSGVFALAATGLLDGQAATTHWRYVDQLRRRFPRIDVRPDVLYVDNGSVLTSAGSAAGIDLGLHLIRRDYGPDIANEVARRMVVPAHRDGGQAQFIARPVAVEEDASLGRTLDWALERLDEPLTVRSLAEHAAMSERTFARRFADATGTTPHRWLTHNRVTRARELLESTRLSVDLVAERSGLGSAANLRHHFERELHTTPTRYRQTFATSA
ncbi:MAG: transcriptional regulator FtrA [Actinomycetota bacterium]